MNRKYRKTIIAGNWKMNKLPSEIKEYANALKVQMPRPKGCEVALCIPSVMIPAAAKPFKDIRVAVGAQDVSQHRAGAYTGEVSAPQLADIGVKYVIVGHSERRQYHGETDAQINRKLHACLEEKLCPILCVGESLEQRDLGITLDFITLQLKSALAGVSGDRMKKIVIAYEPIWAIGTGKTATAQEAGGVCASIRGVLREGFGARVARAVTIQYGGSMNEENARELLGMPDIDGGLIGGASLTPEKFSTIVANANLEDLSQ